MSGPQNGIVGDDAFGLDLPETQVPEEDLVAEKEKARYAKTKDFAVIKDHLEERIAYYQRFLPGNVAPEHIGAEERANYWAVACIVIEEFRRVLNSYEQANEAIEEDKHLEPRLQ